MTTEKGTTHQRGARFLFLILPFLLLQILLFIYIDQQLLCVNGPRREKNDNNSNDEPSLSSASLKQSATLTIPIVPLPKSVQFSQRPTGHLTMSRQRLQPISLPPVNLTYLDGDAATLRQQDSLYGLDNYVGEGFEGAVTHVWLSILHSLAPQQHRRDDYIVVDGGMNTGFYTVLTAAMGFTVHSFELQLDCFDVAHRLVNANGAKAEKLANLYHWGIGPAPQILTIGEGCDPSYGIAQSVQGRAPQKAKKEHKDWEHRSHRVGVLTLDSFLDQVLLQNNNRTSEKKVALLKLDIEGAEIAALQGLVRHRKDVENIIMECAKPFLERYTTMKEVKDGLRSLTDNGFEAYKLYSFEMAHREKWHNETYLRAAGLEQAQRHPILGDRVEEDATTILWRVVDWDLFFEKACPVGCNLLFHRLV